jgi:hypothetical protein
LASWIILYVHQIISSIICISALAHATFSLSASSSCPVVALSLRLLPFSRSLA